LSSRTSSEQTFECILVVGQRRYWSCPTHYPDAGLRDACDRRLSGE
jgi:hypothetical protein